jgi:hypothetical protein
VHCMHPHLGRRASGYSWNAVDDPDNAGQDGRVLGVIPLLVTSCLRRIPALPHHAVRGNDGHGCKKKRHTVESEYSDSE